LPQPLFLLLIVFGCIIFLRSLSIFKFIEFIFHVSSSWVRMRLHAKNQLPWLPGCGLKCSPFRGVVGVVWWRWCVFFTKYNTTPTKLFCFVLCCWLDCSNTHFPGFKSQISKTRFIFL
jgi:hypothetical protein